MRTIVLSLLCWTQSFVCIAIRDRLFTDAGILATDRAEAAMLAVDRAKYCHESDPYLDRPRRIGYNVTISAPHMVSICFKWHIF